MADVRPFRGCRFDTAITGDPGRLIAPPYDVIDSALRDTLFRLSPYNIAHITRADRDEGTANPYATAGALWKSWREAGILKVDPEPSFYVYEQHFEVHGQKLSRTALIGLVKLEKLGDGILPHEHTLTGPRMDRLELMRATRTQLGQVFGLYPDPTGEVEKILAEVKRDRPVVQAADRQDLLHRLWRLTEQEPTARIQQAMRDKQILIADGHHRYETSLAFRDENPNLPAASFRMMALVNMSSPGLVILPIHRLIKGVPNFNRETFLAALRRSFEVRTYPGDTAAVRAAVVEAIRRQQVAGAHAFGLYTGDGRYHAIVARGEALARPDAGHSEAWRSLDVVILHRIVIEEVLGITPERVHAQENIEYIQDFPHNVEEAAARVKSGECQALFLLNPTRVEQVQAVAMNRERMPQKSTFFYPKVYSGMVFYCMDQQA